MDWTPLRNTMMNFLTRIDIAFRDDGSICETFLKQRKDRCLEDLLEFFSNKKIQNGSKTEVEADANDRH